MGTVLLTLVPSGIDSEKEFYDQGTGIATAFWVLILVSMVKVRGGAGGGKVGSQKSPSPTFKVTLTGSSSNVIAGPPRLTSS